MANPFDKSLYPNCFRGHCYAEDIVSGKIVAASYVIGACKRYLREVGDEYNENYFFSPKKAEKFLRLAQKFHHVIGKWKTAEIIFEPWQCWIWMNIMGFIDRRTGFRRFRIAHVEVARGNAKSAMASQAALYFMSLDDPQGNQVATAATKKEQARIVLDSARAMAKKNKSFLKTTGARVLAHSIVHDKSNSQIRALSSEASSLDGLNDVLAVCDELHAMNRATFDVIYSGMSKRKDSLTLCITTAGFDIDSVGYSQSAYAKKVCLGEFEDEQMFAVVYTLDEEDIKNKNFYDESIWIKANPNWDVSVDPITFRAKAEKARKTPSDVNNFLVKHLNVWVHAESPYFDVGKWDKCANPKLKIEDFKGKNSRKGLDLASKRDLASHVDAFYEKGKYYFFFHNYLPQERLKDVHNTLFDDAVAKGDLIATPGDTINNETIRKDIEVHAKHHRVLECLYDPWNATEMAQKLSDKVEMVEFRMNVANLSEPMKKFDQLMREGKIEHNGCQLVRWCLMNVVAKTDHNDNVFPRKPHERLKIDPIVAALMALAGWINDEHKDSVYEERGLRMI